MRRLLFVVFAVFAAASVVSFTSLSASAQSDAQYEPSDGAQEAQGTEPPQGSQENTTDTRASEPAEPSEPPAPPEEIDEPSAEDLDERVLNSVAADPYSQVVDNATRGRFSAPGWKPLKAADAHEGAAVSATEETSRAARFTVDVPENGYYTLYARWPSGRQNASAARFGVPTPGGVRWEEVDQTLDSGTWVRVGSFELARGDGRPVQLAAAEGTVADAVMISKNVLVGANAQMVSVGDPDQTPTEDGTAMRSTSLDGRSGGGGGIVRTARNHLGNPYDYDHRRCRRGMAREDCSCLTRNVFLKHGRKLRDSPVYQWREGRKIARSQMRPGDLVFHDLNKDGDLKDHYVDHVSIWSGNGNIIHASSYFGKVVESKEQYLKNYWGAKRVRTG